MNKRINKNVLDGFLNQAISHNKYIEEREMWKKRREEKDSKKRKLSREEDDSFGEEIVKTSKKPAVTETNEDSGEIDDLKVMLALYQDLNKKPVERWGHSGYAELYGTEASAKSKPTSSRPYIPKIGSESESEEEEEKSSKKHKKHKHRHKKKKSKKSKKDRSSSSSSRTSSESSRRKSHHKHKRK